MMKSATENTLPTQIVPGHAGTRHAGRGRIDTDQLTAEFEGLLARQPMVRGDAKSQTPEDAAPDGEGARPARSTPEALFLALAGGRELAAEQQGGEDPSGQSEAAADGALEPDGDAPRRAADPTQPRSNEVQAQLMQPAIRAEGNEEGMVTKADPLVMPKAARAEAPRFVSERFDSADIHAATPGVPDHESARAEPAAEKRVFRFAGEGRGIEDAEKSPGGTSPFALIRVAGQETHFAPSPVVVFDDHKIDALAMNAPAGPDEPSRAQPAPPPLVVKPASGPLRMLKVELGSHELGLINATMALKDKALDLRLGAARDDTVASLKEGAGRLSDTLQALGFSVDGVTVQKMHQSDGGNQTGNGQSMQQGAPGQDGSGQNQQRGLNGSGSGAGGSSGQSRHTPHDDHLAEQNGNDQAKNAGGARNSRDVIL